MPGLKKNTSSCVQTVTQLKNINTTKCVDAQVYVTFHPQSVLRGGFELESRIVKDLARFKNKTLRPPKHGLPGGSVVGWDTEYAVTGKLLTTGVADADSAFAEENGFEQSKQTIKKAKVICGHSVAGDLDYLVRLGVARDSWLRGLDVKDSFLLARMYDENRGKGGYGLETLLLSEFNAPSWKSATDALLKKTGNAADWTPEQRMERCRMDAWATVLLTKHFEEKLNAVR